MCIRDRIKANQIEAARVAMTRYIKRGGKVWIKIFPEKPVTHKPMGVRMGKGCLLYTSDVYKRQHLSAQEEQSMRRIFRLYMRY